jgi:hypothetical protein
MRWRRLPEYWIEDLVNDDHSAIEPMIEGGGDGPQRVGLWGEFQLPLEVAPVLGRVDLDSLDSILHFVREFGLLGVDRDTLGNRGYSPSLWSDGGNIDVELPDVTRSEVLSPHAIAARQGEWVADFQAGASVIIAGTLIEHELSYEDRFSPMRLSKAWPAHTPWEPPGTARSARFLLSRLMDYGLAHQELRTTPNLDGKGEFAVVSTPRDSLFARMLLEIVQAQAENLPYRRCAKCNVMFSKQSGGSRYQSRADAMYCSTLCARAAAQAAWRKRQRNGGR